MAKRQSQPVVLTSDHSRMQPKDMNDIFYVRHEKNLTELYSKARGSIDHDAGDGRITSPLTGSLDQSGMLVKNASMTTQHVK